MSEQIPRRPSDVTAAWLSAVLSTTGAQVTVADVDIHAVGTGQTGATYRITPRYTVDDPGLPATFVLKLPAQDDSVRGGVALGYISEVAFYRKASAFVKVPVPHCYYCDISEDGTDFALLLDDLHPATQGDQLAGCTVHDAELAVTALAGLHGPSWCDARWLDLTECAMPKPGDLDASEGLGEICRTAVDIVLDKLGSRLDASTRDTLGAAMQLVTPWLLAGPERYALMHGDYRLDNLLFDVGTDTVGVVDWQTMGVGLAARDLAYFIGTGMLPDARRAAEADLVATYHEALLRFGVSGYSRAMCWDDYRFGMLQIPLLATLGTAFATTTERGDEMMVVMLERGCEAIRDLGTLDLVGKRAR
ncbi:phosphotransferase family protein [Rhodococcus phenolicus]|uniref:phosphotransferase family protein n=1 Tax=Rhodococcus phenolicus TaxID=263849 RepID=UPI000835CC5F|nr:phosphotransferase [Rhodococcus phenolicus]